MKIFKPQAITEIGKRNNQEDSIFPLLGNATENDRLFLVCDGMGGHESGEVASNSVCNSISSFLKDVNPDTISIDDFREALIYAYDQLDQIDSAPQNVQRKMGTTLTFLYLGNKKAIIAHIGDSRVYQLRPNENNGFDIIHKTNDHSWVSLLIRNGEITEEEAKTHPLKNQITRAIQPNLDERCKATVYESCDVKAGDYFFLCSDGVLESVTDESLQEIVAGDCSDEEKIEKIKEICAQNSRDNNSAYLIHIEEGIDILNADKGEGLIVSNNVEVDPNKPKAAEEFVMATMANEATANAQSNNMPTQSATTPSLNLTQHKHKATSKGGDMHPKQKRPFSNGVIAGLVAAIILCIGGCILCINSFIDDDKKEERQEKTIEKDNKDDSPKKDKEEKDSDKDNEKETKTIKIEFNTPAKSQEGERSKPKAKVTHQVAPQPNKATSQSSKSSTPPKKNKLKDKTKSQNIGETISKAFNEAMSKQNGNKETKPGNDHVENPEKLNN